MEDVKPGWKTTECWVTFWTQILALLVVAGVVKPKDQGAMTDALTSAIQGAAALIASGWAVVHYIQSRRAIKVATANTPDTASPFSQ